jgi:hypothetical protein
MPLPSNPLRVGAASGGAQGSSAAEPPAGHWWGQRPHTPTETGQRVRSRVLPMTSRSQRALSLGRRSIVS